MVFTFALNYERSSDESGMDMFAERLPVKKMPIRPLRPGQRERNSCE